MSDDDSSPIKEKTFSTPESRQKISSKFKNILDDLEFKSQKLLKNNTKEKENNITSISNSNSNLDTAVNSDNNKKDIVINNSKNKNNQNKINNKKLVKKFNSFEGGQLKKNEKKNNEIIKKSNNNNNNNNNALLLSRMSKEITKLTHQRNSISGINHINININININNKNNTSNNNNNNNNKVSKKLRPSTPSIRNQEDPNNNNKNKKENKEKIDPLYIPHIVKDPLDILKQKVEKIINISDNEISNISNKICLSDIEMENLCASAHENYATKLSEIFEEKEKKMRETYNKYDYALYKMFKTYGENNNVIYDEMMKDKVDQIIEIEQEFNNKKNKLKIELNEKIEDIKKNIEKKRKKEDNNYINMLNDVKKNIFNILYDKDIKDAKDKNNNKDNNKINNSGDKKNIKKTQSFFDQKK